MRTDCERRSSCGVCKNRYGIAYNKTLLREHGWESHGFTDDRHPRPSRAAHLRPSSFL